MRHTKAKKNEAEVLTAKRFPGDMRVEAFAGEGTEGSILESWGNEHERRLCMRLIRLR